jgi:hypothetical protein
MIVLNENLTFGKIQTRSFWVYAENKYDEGFEEGNQDIERVISSKEKISLNSNLQKIRRKNGVEKWPKQNKTTQKSTH